MWKYKNMYVAVTKEIEAEKEEEAKALAKVSNRKPPPRPKGAPNWTGLHAKRKFLQLRTHRTPPRLSLMKGMQIHNAKGLKGNMMHHPRYSCRRPMRSRHRQRQRRQRRRRKTRSRRRRARKPMRSRHHQRQRRQRRRRKGTSRRHCLTRRSHQPLRRSPIMTRSRRRRARRKNDKTAKTYKKDKNEKKDGVPAEQVSLAS